jgi:hypothetical protein
MCFGVAFAFLLEVKVKGFGTVNLFLARFASAASSPCCSCPRAMTFERFSLLCGREYLSDLWCISFVVEAELLFVIMFLNVLLICFFMDSAGELVVRARVLLASVAADARAATDFLCRSNNRSGAVGEVVSSLMLVVVVVTFFVVLVATTTAFCLVILPELLEDMI